jgi:hypothetical protein
MSSTDKPSRPPSQQTATAPTWTLTNVRRVWPKSSDLIQWPPEPSRRAYFQRLLATVQSAQQDAYECLRLARWGTETGLRVACPRCGKRAWSHSPKQAKHRWRCVSEPMYRRHQETKGYQIRGATRSGCGFSFSDETGTPFEDAPVRLGLVFLALYLSPTTTEELLHSVGEPTLVVGLSQVLTALQQKEYATLHRRLHAFAKLFCGRILLRDHRVLLSFRGEKRVMANLATYATIQKAARATNMETLVKVNAHYKKAGQLLAKLQRLHQAYLMDRPIAGDRAQTIHRELLASVLALRPGRSLPNDE